MKAVFLMIAALIGGEGAPVMQGSDDTPQTIPGQCRPDALQRVIGRAQGMETEEFALRLSGANEVRWIAPGDPISMDYAMDRINLETDGQRVVRAYCG